LPKTALITGIAGQDGAYLARLLLEKGYTVHGTTRRSSMPQGHTRLEALGVIDHLHLHESELTEASNLQRLVGRVAPDEIYNLAAQSHVATSFDVPIYTTDINALGPLRLLEIVRTMGGKCRFYQASTSEMFGNAPAPQSEETPLNPRSPYAAAKTLAHHATLNYASAFGLHASSGILFNHESPLRGIGFVTRKVARGLAHIALGRQDKLLLGNLDAVRDWGYAPDYVEGMWRMLQHDSPRSFVLATGEGHTVRDFVEAACRSMDWSIAWSGEGEHEIAIDTKTGRTIITIDPQLYRPLEVNKLVGDPSLAERELGWTRSVDFAQLVDLMIRHDLHEATAR